MSKRQKRQQRQKGMGNEDLYRAMQELRRSSAAEPVRNKAKYRRADFRNQMQRGRWED